MKAILFNDCNVLLYACYDASELFMPQQFVGSALTVALNGQCEVPMINESCTAQGGQAEPREGRVLEAFACRDYDTRRQVSVHKAQRNQILRPMPLQFSPEDAVAADMGVVGM